VPTGPVPIKQPIALRTLFDGAIGGLTLPAHSGVENLPLLTGTGEGFVITHVPAGLHVPYQTLYPKQEYYIRAGSSFLSTPHAVLAGLFGRAPQPYPAPVVRFGAVGAQTTGRRFMQLRLNVSVVNKGRGFAEDIFCVVDAKWPQPNAVRYELDATHVRDAPGGWRNTNYGRDYYTQMLGNMKLPPGAEARVLIVKIEIGRGGLGDYAFTVSCGSRAGPGAAQRIVLTGDVVDGAFEHYTYQYPSDAQKKVGDDQWEARIKECVGNSASSS
jgi:hypothetical protein